MKSLITSILLFCSLLVTAQNKEFTVILKDQNSKVVVKEATITIFKNSNSAMSNDDGVFKFSITGDSDVEIIHEDYLPIYVNTAEFTEKVNIVYMTPLDKQLEEIIITKVHPQLLLEDLIANSTKSLTTPINLKIYVLEFFKKNNVYSSFNDGLLNFQIYNNGSSRKSDILVEQNRFYGLVEESLWANAIGYNLNNLIVNYYDFNYLKAVLENKALKKYDFQVRGINTNPDLYVMHINVMDHVKEALADFEIIYDYKKNLIVEIISQINPSKYEYADVTKFNITKGKMFHSFFNAKYKMEGDLYYLNSSKEEIGIDHVNKKKKVDKIEVKNYFVTTSRDRELMKYNKEDVYTQQSLNNINTNFQYDYWDFNSGLTPTEEERKIIETLAEF